MLTNWASQYPYNILRPIFHWCAIEMWANFLKKGKTTGCIWTTVSCFLVPVSNAGNWKIGLSNWVRNWKFLDLFTIWGDFYDRKQKTYGDLNHVGDQDEGIYGHEEGTRLTLTYRPAADFLLYQAARDLMCFQYCRRMLQKFNYQGILGTAYTKIWSFFQNQHQLTGYPGNNL